MNTESYLAEFLDDIDETLQAEGMILVGHFVWILRGMERGLSDAQMQALSEQAYPVVRERYRTRLMWSGWPIDLASAKPASESTALAFDLDPDASVHTPVLVLVLLD